MPHHPMPHAEPLFVVFMAISGREGYVSLCHAAIHCHHTVDLACGWGRRRVSQHDLWCSSAEQALVQSSVI